MENTHDDPYERALHDPGFLDAVRAQHRGRWDVLDALWWATHPADTAPSGRPAPLVRVEALQKRVFAADADAVGDPDVSRTLQQLQSEIVRERTLIDAAIVAAHIGEGRALAKARLPDAVVGTPAHPVPVPAGPDLAPERAAGEHAAPGGTRLRLAAGFTVAVLLGVVIGGQLAEAASGTVPAAPASMAAFDPATVPALAIFDRAQVAADTPRVPLPASFDPSSLRAVASVRWHPAGALAESPYYVARAESDRVCLLLMVDDAHYLSTCADVAEFARTGVGLYWTSDQAFATEEATPTPGPWNYYLEWGPAGTHAVGPAGSDIPT